MYRNSNSLGLDLVDAGSDHLRDLLYLSSLLLSLVIHSYSLLDDESDDGELELLASLYLPFFHDFFWLFSS